MADITLQAKLRAEMGSRPAGRMRAAGLLPAVVYGKGHESLHLTLNHHDVSLALHDTATREGAITLVVDGQSHKVKLQQIQRDPVRRTAAHLDFVFA